MKYSVTTSGGIYTSAVLNLSDNTIQIKLEGFKLLKNLINQLPLKFEKNKRVPEKIYINEYGVLKIKYSNAINDCELTIKMNAKKLDSISGHVHNLQKNK